jgi:hypothetical protein
MGYTVTDTVSCRLLPSQIAELRRLAATEGVSLSRLVSGLCLTAIQGRESNHAPERSSDSHGSPSTREDEPGSDSAATLDTKCQRGNSPSSTR